MIKFTWYLCGSFTEAFCLRLKPKVMILAQNWPKTAKSSWQCPFKVLVPIVGQCPFSDSWGKDSEVQKQTSSSQIQLILSIAALILCLAIDFYPDPFGVSSGFPAEKAHDSYFAKIIVPVLHLKKWLKTWEWNLRSSMVWKPDAIASGFKPWRTRYESVNYGISNYWST